MNVFVSYWFDDPDKWIEEMIFPLIEAFGCSVISGKNLYGQGEIEGAVFEKIKVSDAFIGFRTRRGWDKTKEKWMTHEWVDKEFDYVLKSKKIFVEVREDGVGQLRGGMTDNHQIINLNLDKRDECIVEVAKFLSNILRKREIQFRLLPKKCVDEIMPIHNKKGFKSHYKTYLKGSESKYKKIKVRSVQGGLYADVKVDKINPESAFKLEMQYNGKKWSSEYEGIDAIGIQLQKESK